MDTSNAIECEILDPLLGIERRSQLPESNVQINRVNGRIIIEQPGVRSTIEFDPASGYLLGITTMQDPGSNASESGSGSSHLVCDVEEVVSARQSLSDLDSEFPELARS